MSDTLTLTREWMELLDGIADDGEFRKVLHAVWDFAIAGKEPDELSPIGKCVFMTIRKGIMERKRKNRYYSNKSKLPSKSPSKSPSKLDGQNVQVRRSDDLFDLSSNQHIDTFNPLSSISEDIECFPQGEKQKKSKVFKVPTLEEVRAYCKERRNAVNPEEFYAYYQCKDWQVGRSRMKDWHAAVRYWEQKMYEDRKSLSQKRDYSGI